MPPDPYKIPIIFFGTPDFAVPSLQGLLDAHYTIVAVVTNPDEPVGRTQIITPPPMKVVAQKVGIPVFQPTKLDLELWQKDLPHADLFVVTAYGKLIPQSILAFPKFGAVNLHPSLLPRWRGPSPIQYTILNGDQETGCTVMKIDELMDHGPVLSQEKLMHNISNVRFPALCDLLAEQGAKLLLATIPRYLFGEVVPIPQNDAEATFSKILKKDDGRVNWKAPAETIERMIRAFNPWPGTWTLWPGEKKIYRIKIEEGYAAEDESPYGSPGYLWRNSSGVILIKTGKGSVVIQKITLEGRSITDVEDFSKGYPNFVGATMI